MSTKPNKLKTTPLTAHRAFKSQAATLAQLKENFTQGHYKVFALYLGNGQEVIFNKNDNSFEICDAG